MLDDLTRAMHHTARHVCLCVYVGMCVCVCVSACVLCAHAFVVQTHYRGNGNNTRGSAVQVSGLLDVTGLQE